MAHLPGQQGHDNAAVRLIYALYTLTSCHVPHLQTVQPQLL